MKNRTSPIGSGSANGPRAFTRSRPSRWFYWAIVFPLFLSASAWSAELNGETARAWDKYLQWADQKVQRELATPGKFLLEDHLASKDQAEVRRKLQEGQIFTGKVSGVVPAGTSFSVPDGEIHHWWGAVLLPNIQLSDLLSFLQDYDHHAGRFADVEESRLISKQNGYYRFYFRLKHTQAFVTANFNTEQECLYTTWDPKRISSRSNAIKIAELENPGTQAEQEKPPGNDRGFMWRLVSWWRFQQVESGVIVELESASLSRSIPGVVKLLPGISNYIRSMPRKSLESILTTIREFARSGENNPAAQ